MDTTNDIKITLSMDIAGNWWFIWESIKEGIFVIKPFLTPNNILTMKKEKRIENAIKEILKPFIYRKYGKIYIEHKETEGALRVEGLILQIEKVLKKNI